MFLRLWLQPHWHLCNVCSCKLDYRCISTQYEMNISLLQKCIT